jgi:hypothetical protein
VIDQIDQIATRMRLRRIAYDLMDQPPQVNRLGTQGEAFIQTGKKQEVLDQPGQSDAFLTDPAHGIVQPFTPAQMAMAPELGDALDRSSRCP